MKGNSIAVPARPPMPGTMPSTRPMTHPSARNPSRCGSINRTKACPAEFAIKAASAAKLSMTLKSHHSKISTSRDVSAGECRTHVIPELDYRAADYRDFFGFRFVIHRSPPGQHKKAAANPSQGSHRFPTHVYRLARKKQRSPPRFARAWLMKSLASWYGRARSSPGFSAVAFRKSFALTQRQKTNASNGVGSND